MVEPDNPEEFAKGLFRYLESAELTAAGKNHAEIMFSLEKCWIDMRVNIDV
jgi:hypothetical protein